jgi:hypothetical protein
MKVEDAGKHTELLTKYKDILARPRFPGDSADRIHALRRLTELIEEPYPFGGTDVPSPTTPTR